MTTLFRRPLFAFALGAALTAAVVLGRAAYATESSIEACFKPSNGTLYLLGDGSSRTECQPEDIPISWNAAGINGRDGVDGQDGADGVSVTSVALAPGDDANCPNGGSKFTSSSGVTYACNGTDGQDGEDGEDGEDFAGTFTSPSGLYRLGVSDTGIRLEGPTGRLSILDGATTLDSALGLTLRAGTVASLIGTGGVSAQSPVQVAVTGGQIHLNGGGCGLLRPTDVAAAVGPDGGPVLLNPAGALTVRTTC